MKGAIGYLAVSLSIVTVVIVCMLSAGDGARAATTYVDGNMVIYDDTTLRDGTWDINGSIIVHSGTLRVEDAILFLNSTDYRNNRIQVNTSCKLEVYRSRIEGTNYPTGIMTYGSVILDNTTVYNLDSSSVYGGIQPYDGDVTVDHCTFDTGRYGIMCFYSGPYMNIRDTTFVNISSYIIYWSPQVDGAKITISDCTVKGTGSGYGIYLSNQGGNRYSLDASITGCTLEDLRQAITCEAFMDTGTVVVEDNVVRDCYQGAYLNSVGGAVTLQWNRWEINNDNNGYGIYIYPNGQTSPTVNNETTVGGEYGYRSGGYGNRMDLWDMDLTGAVYGIHNYYDNIYLHDSYVRAIEREFFVDDGYIYLYDCDHTYKAYVSGYGAVLEPARIDFTSVAWQEGTPITEGRVYFENETREVLTNMDLEDQEPVDIPLWMYTRYENITVDEVRAKYKKDSFWFRSAYFDPRGVSRMDLVIIDNATPEVVVVRPTEGEMFDTDMLWFKGNWSEQGLGMGTVRVRYTGSDWMEAKVLEEGNWQIFLTDVPDGLRDFWVNITDRAGNSREVVVPNITIDTVWPRIDVLRPLRYVSASVVHLTGRTEPLSEAFVDHRRVEVMFDGMFSALLTLSDGENEIFIRVVDQVGHVNETLYYIILDTEPPALMVETPMEGCWLAGDSVLVTGTSETDAVVYANGFTGNMEYGRFSIVVPLAVGTSLVTVTARDLAGNMATVVRTVHVDRTYPEVKFTSPEHESATSDERIVLSGTVTEANLDRVLVNNLSADVVDESWFREVRLEPGVNVFTVVAIDAAGNQADASIRITLDLTAPVISARITVNGVEHGPSGTPVITSTKSIDIWVDSNERSTLTINTGAPFPFGPGSTTRDLFLESGSNKYVVHVLDLVGNSADPLTFVVVLDETPPVLTLASTIDVVYTKDTQYLVQGVTEPGCEVMVNDIPTPVTAVGSFALWVPLEEGPNSIRIVSMDAAGNTASHTQQVVREAEEEEGGLFVGGAAAGAITGLIAGLVIALVVVFLMGRRGQKEEGLYEETHPLEPEPPKPEVEPPAAAPVLEPVPVQEPQAPSAQTVAQPQEEQPYQAGEDEWESF